MNCNESVELTSEQQVNRIGRDALARYAANIRTLPNRGAALTVNDDGLIGDGMGVVARFSSRRAAFRALRSLGFIKVCYGWKLDK